MIETTTGNSVEDSDRSPKCGERDADRLVWQDDDTVRCRTCGALYRPLDHSN